MNWDQIFSRLSVTGVTALLCGALLCIDDDTNRAVKIKRIFERKLNKLLFLLK